MAPGMVAGNGAHRERVVDGEVARWWRGGGTPTAGSSHGGRRWLRVEQWQFSPWMGEEPAAWQREDVRAAAIRSPDADTRMRGRKVWCSGGRRRREIGGGRHGDDGGWRPRDRRGRCGPNATTTAWNGARSRWAGADGVRSHETREVGSPTVGPGHNGGRQGSNGLNRSQFKLFKINSNVFKF
jgi:hypothetical protein